MDLGVLQASVSLNTAAFSRGVREVKGGFSEMASAAIALNQSIDLFDKVANGTIGTVARLGTNVVDTAARFDMLKLSLDTITKGGGEKWFKDLNTFAIKMPGNTEQIIGAFTRMRSMGLKPAIDDLRILVDTMSARGGDMQVLDSISQALGHMNTMGVVHLQQLYQIANAGVPVFEILRKYTDITDEQIQHIGKSAFNSEGVIKALLLGMNDLYGGQSEKIQHKYTGMMESFKGCMAEFQRQIMADGTMDYIEKNMQSVMDKLDAAFDSGQFSELAREFSDDATHMLSKFVDFAEGVWNNRDKILEVLETVGKYAKETGDGMLVLKDALSSLVSAASSVTGSLPGDVVKWGAVGVLLMGTLGYPGIIAGLALVAEDFEKRRKEILDKIDSGEPVVDSEFIASLTNAKEAVADFFSQFHSGMDAEGQFYQALSDSRDMLDGVQATTQATTEATDAMGASLLNLNEYFGALPLQQLIGGFGDITDKVLESDARFSVFNNTVETLTGLGKTLQEMLDGISTSAGKATFGIAALNDEMGNSILLSLNMTDFYQNIPAKLTTLPGKIHLTSRGSSGSGSKSKESKAENAMNSITGTNKQLKEALQSVGLPSVEAQLKNIQGEYEKMIEKHKKYFSESPEMENAIGKWKELKEQIETAKFMSETDTKFDDLINEAGFNNSIALMNQFSQSIAQANHEADQLQLELDRAWKNSTNPKVLEYLDSFKKRIEELRDKKLDNVTLNAMAQVNQSVLEQQYANILAAIPDTESNQFQRIMEENRQAVEKLGLSGEQAAKSLESLNKVKFDNLNIQFEASIKKIGDLTDAVHEAFQRMGDDLSDAMSEWMESGKINFGDIIKTFIKDLQITAAHHAAALLMEAAFQGAMAIAEPQEGHAAKALAVLKEAGVMSSFVLGSGLAGMAHDGIDAIPEQGTWLLNKGERVVDSQTNQDLKQFIAQGSKPVNNIQVVINEPKDKQSVMDAIPKLKETILQVVNQDIATNGQTRTTIKTYT